MSKRTIEPAMVFGHWTTIRPVLKNKRSYWFCICQCGVESLVRTENLGIQSMSCGCRGFWKFDSAHAFVLRLNLKNEIEWNVWRKSGDRPNGIPSDPQRHYRNQGWQGWGYFLRNELKNEKYPNNNKPWSAMDVEVLTNYGVSESQEQLTARLGRPWQAIKRKLILEKIRRKSHFRMHSGVSRMKNNITRLLDDSLVSWYYMGFLLADGSISGNCLSCFVSEKDKQWMLQFCSYLDVVAHTRDGRGSFEHYACSSQVGFSAQDSEAISKIKFKFDFKIKKTYNPPDINILPDGDRLVAFFIGFLDGDGSIYTNTYVKKDGSVSQCSFLQIVCHINWMSFLNEFNNRTREALGLDAKEGYTTCRNLDEKSRQYTGVRWCTTSELQTLKTKALELKLPFMERKLGQVDMEFLSMRDKKLCNIEETEVMFQNGMNKDEIALALCVHESSVRNYLRILKNRKSTRITEMNCV